MSIEKKTKSGIGGAFIGFISALVGGSFIAFMILYWKSLPDMRIESDTGTIIIGLAITIIPILSILGAIIGYIIGYYAGGKPKKPKKPKKEDSLLSIIFWICLIIFLIFLYVLYLNYFRP